MDRGPAKTLDGECCLGFSADPGETLSHLAKIRRSHSTLAEEAVEEPRRSNGNDEFAIYPTLSTSFSDPEPGAWPSRSASLNETLIDHVFSRRCVTGG